MTHERIRRIMTLEAPAAHPRLGDLLCVAVLAAGLDAAIAFYVGTHRPAYLRDAELFINPDARHYVLLGRNFWDRGAYSRMNRPPYAADVMRTPVYPVVAGGLDKLAGGPWGVYAFQAACRMLLAVAVCGLGCAVFGRATSVLAGVLVAADPALATLDFESMSEPLFNLLASVAILIWLRGVAQPAGGDRPGRRAIVVGGLLGLAALTRPAGMYLPLVLGLFQAVLSVAERNVRSLVWAVGLVVASALCIAPWVARNNAVAGVPRLTTADSINLVYFAGAGAYAVEHQVSLTEAQEMIRQEYGLVSLVESNNFWTVDRPVQQIDAELRAAAPLVLRKYPRSLAVATATGVGKALVAHNVAILAEMAGTDWYPPGLGTALRGDWSAFGATLGQNDGVLVGFFVWELVWAVGLVTFGGVGAAAGLAAAPLRRPMAALVMVAAYYLATVGVVGLDAYMRHRSMLVPLLALFAAVGIVSGCGRIGVARGTNARSS